MIWADASLLVADDVNRYVHVPSLNVPRFVDSKIWPVLTSSAETVTTLASVQPRRLQLSRGTAMGAMLAERKAGSIVRTAAVASAHPLSSLTERKRPDAEMVYEKRPMQTAQLSGPV